VTTRAALGVWTLALLVAAGATLLVASSDHENDKLPTILLAVPTALAFVASGIIARAQRPKNPTGILLILVGFAWSFGALTTANNDYVFTAGLVLGTIFTGLLGHLFLAFPTGRLTSKADRRIVVVFYAVVVAIPPLVFLFDEGEIATTSCDGPCPDNVLSIIGYQPVATVIAIVYAAATLSLATLVLVRLIIRWRRASPALRRSLAPVFVTAAGLIAIAVFQSILGFFSEELAEAINRVTLVAVLAVPLSFLYGLLRPRLGTATRRLVADLSERRRPAEVQAVLRRTLRDSDLQLGYRAADGDGYIDIDGGPLELPAPGSERVVTNVGESVIVHDVAIRDQPELDAAVDAARIALERGVSLTSLEASVRHTTALLDAIPDNVYRIRSDGTFLDAKMKRNLGVFGGPEMFIGRTIDDVMPPDIAPRLTAAMARVLETGALERVEYALPFEGAFVHIEARIVRSGDDEVVAITRDVSDLKRSEQAMRVVADEQTALRRVATLAAEVGERESERLFRAVTEEAGHLLDAQTATTIRFSDDGSATVVGSWSAPGIEEIPSGTIVPLDSDTPLVQVSRTGKAARIDSYEGLPGALAERMRRTGRRSGIAAPIFVSGRLWGAVHAGRTTTEPFPERAEQRIGQFGEIVGIALANAEAREQLASLAEEQAALSRVALAVATASRPETLFDIVTEEVARLLGADAANLVRFEADNETDGFIVGEWADEGVRIAPKGTRVEMLGGALTRVRQTGRPSRGHIDDPDNSQPELVARLRELGVKALVAAPIEVLGSLWGAVVVSVTTDRTFPPDAEERISQFASLVAVALANAEAREQLSGLAEEQAAHSRVAVAVATEEEPDRLFNAVSEEVGRLLGAQSAATVRYVDGEDASVIVGGWDRDGWFDRVGARVPFQGGAIERVYATGRPARIDAAEAPPDVQARMADEGVSSGVAAPIMLSGRLWGATSVSIGPVERFAPDAEQRLGKFTDLVSVALANAEAREELTASRARIVQASDAARRRLERNLHDGAQQRLVTLSLTLRLAQSKLADDPAGAREMLEASSSELALALEELRELARGLHPAILSDQGLGAALEALAARAPLPVELHDVPPDRLPPPVEAAAYYVVAETLTNVAKYARARSAHVTVSRQNGYAIVEVEDDGIGGADVSRGSGLRGLADRVEALDGRLVLTSEPGQGTRVRAEIPCGT
jgi:signal transduction histidine kinase